MDYRRFCEMINFDENATPELEEAIESLKKRIKK